MAKQKGHRANKPNDSFGTVNNDTLYRGKYRDEVYVDEDDDDIEETVEAADPSQEEATPQEASFVQEKQKDDGHDYKKRYDDLKKHYDAKVDEFKSEIESLRRAVNTPRVDVPSGVKAPRTIEELEEFKEKYPEVYEMVESVSSAQTEAQVSELRQELDHIKGREKELEKQKAYEELLRLQPEFNDIKTDQKFLDWLEEQPASISDGIYKNNTDARWAARVVDLYKADTGSTPKKRTKKNTAADAVSTPVAKEVNTSGLEGKRLWKASEIAKMKPWEFEKNEAELDAARSEGRIDFNN